MPAKISEKKTKEIAGEILPKYDEIMNIYHMGNISASEDTILVAKDGYEYFVIENERYPTIEAVKEATEKICTFNFACAYYYKAFSGTDRSLYQEIDGRLCRAAGDMTTMLAPVYSTAAILYCDKTQILASVSLRWPFSPNHKMYFTILNTRDGWRIDNMYDTYT